MPETPNPDIRRPFFVSGAPRDGAHRAILPRRLPNTLRKHQKWSKHVLWWNGQHTTVAALSHSNFAQCHRSCTNYCLYALNATNLICSLVENRRALRIASWNPAGSSPKISHHSSASSATTIAHLTNPISCLKLMAIKMLICDAARGNTKSGGLHFSEFGKKNY